MIYFILQCSLVYSCFKQSLGNYVFSVHQFMKNVNHILLWLRETQNALQLLVFFFFLFFCQPYPGLQNCKLVFLILKIWQHGRSRQLVQHFPRYPCKIWYKNWYLHFCKTYDHQILQEVTSTGFDSNEAIQTIAGDVITSRWRDKLKKYISTTEVSTPTNLGRLVTYLDGLLPIKSHDSLISWSWKIT